MRWLILIPVVVCLLLVASSGLVVVYGRTLPAPPFERFEEAGLDICQGKFCLFEITPGITTWDEALQTLADNVTRDEGDHFHGRVGVAEIRVQIGANGPHIGVMDVQATTRNQDGLALRFGQIVQQFWTPCRVTYSSRGNGSFVLTYPWFRIEVVADRGLLSLNSPISRITLVDNDDLDPANRSCAGTFGGVPWRGLASVEAYEGQRLRDWEVR